MIVNLKQLKIDDVVSYNLVRASLLQKLIRRSLLPEALFVVDLYLEDKQTAGLNRRLLQIAVEDVGLCLPNAIELLEAEPDFHKKVALLCLADKNREVDRFMLTVAYRPIRFKNADPQTQKEGVTMHKLIKLSTLWFENKRKKENLQNLKDYVSSLADKSKWKTTILKSLDIYLDLSRANVHGARVMLGLISLLSTREIDERPVPDVSSLPERVEVVNVPDYALDRHTPFGKILKRDFYHWQEHGAFVSPELKYPDLLDSKNEEKYPLAPLIPILENLK